MPTANAMSVAIGMPQPEAVGVPALKRGIDERGHDHAAGGRDDGQRRILERRQLAHQNLALELEADEQEEERHQPVVDPDAASESSQRESGSSDDNARLRAQK